MLSLSEISTVSASFRDDLRAYAAAGFDGIGIWEMKLGANDEDNLEAVRASGLSVTNCVPLVPSILPNTVIEGPEDVETRIESLCASVRRFAPFEPDCVLCLTGCNGSPPRPMRQASASGSSRSTPQSATRSRSSRRFRKRSSSSTRRGSQTSGS
jgi:sugar phosphate isomerase/epimerase